MKIKKVFSLDKALQLRNMGNEIIYSEPNKKYSKFQVFIFENTSKLNQDWKKLK